MSGSPSNFLVAMRSGKFSPLEDYMQLSKEITRHVDGLPLALKVLGSHLRGGTVAVWTSECEKLKKIHPKGIFEKLKISFDGLDDDTVQDLFLDIACFFIGEDKEYVKKILNGCGFYVESGIRILIDRCLLSIESNKLRMHDQVRDMGREIVRRESLQEPGKRSRVWSYKDVRDVLKKKKGTKAVKGVTLQIGYYTASVTPSTELHFCTESFKKMVNLRSLQIDHAHLSGNFGLMSKELRWLSWKYCPLRRLPSDFFLEDLVFMDMRHSKFEQAWEDSKVLTNLRILDLSYGRALRQCPDFSKVPQLEELSFSSCLRLSEIHPSIGYLKRLQLLDLSFCRKLRNLPSTICSLTSLEKLDISLCRSIECLPCDIGNMEKLRVLRAKGTLIRQLPDSIGHLKNLQKLSTSISFLPPSFSNLHSLKMLEIDFCSQSVDGDIAPGIESLSSSLVFLDLKGINSSHLPHSISQLSKLTHLSLYECHNLLSLSELPISLRHLFISFCESLEKVNLSNFEELPDEINISFNSNLTEIQGLGSLGRGCHINAILCCRLHLPMTQDFFKGKGKPYEVHFPTSNIPDWFDHQTTGSSVLFSLEKEREYVGITLSVVYLSMPFSGWDLSSETSRVYVYVIDQINDVELTKRSIYFDAKRYHSEHSWVFYIPKEQYIMGSSARIKVDVVSKDPSARVKIMKCGIHVWYKGDNAIEKNQSDC